MLRKCFTALPVWAETRIANSTQDLTVGEVSESRAGRPCVPEKTDLAIRPTKRGLQRLGKQIKRPGPMGTGLAVQAHQTVELTFLYS
jgi:hypothetical protein